MTATLIPPYISAGEFDKFINHLRKRKPDPLTLKILQEIGVSKSNSYTLFGSLVRMGIYSEDGALLQRDDVIGLSAKDESIRRETFQRILKRTYGDLMNEIPIEEATVEKVRYYFEVNGASAAPALKGARLFIWIANQAGYKTAEVEYVPYNLEQEKTQKPKEAKRKKNTSRSTNNEYHVDISAFAPKTADDYEERLLNILLDKISSSDGMPPAEILQQVRELIDSRKEKSKSHQASKTPEPLSRKENGDA